MKVNILVVDDRPEGLMAVEAVLKSPDYNLVTASSGMEALKFLLKDEFAVILMDVQMPGMNGFETAEIIKTREKSKDIPIIFMSAISQDQQYVYQGYGVGAIDYIMKPFDPYILKSKVSIFVDLYQKNIKLMEQAKLLHENEIRFYAQALDKLELESLRKYQYLADSIPQIVFRLLPDGNHEYFNKVWFHYTGYTIERSQGKGWKDAVHPEDLESLFTSMSNGIEMEAECRVMSKHGEYRWHLVQLRPERYNNVSEVTAWLGTATDIEDRKRNENSQRLLVKAGKVLVSSLNYQETFEKAAELFVKEIADCCRFEVLNENGNLEEVAFRYNQSEDSDRNSFQDFDTRKVITSAQPVFTAETIIVPMIANGRPLGALSLMFKSSGNKYNETHLKTAEELGRRAAMALENSLLYILSQEAIEIRNNFLSIASHELNTPITTLKLQLQIAKKVLNDKEGDSEERFEKSLSSSLRQVDRLITLIGELLDVSKIQSGKFHFNFAKSSVYEVVDEVVERHREIFSASGCQLLVSDVPKLQVRWDKMRIEQVLINLLMNAVKYAPGKIELNVKEEKGHINLEVRDFGKGIQSDKVNSIFDRFSRATSDSVAGMGLGLYIVKEIVEGHGGRIEVDSSEKGCSFRVTLPSGNQEQKKLQHTFA